MYTCTCVHTVGLDKHQLVLYLVTLSLEQPFLTATKMEDYGPVYSSQLMPQGLKITCARELETIIYSAVYLRKTHGGREQRLWLIQGSFNYLWSAFINIFLSRWFNWLISLLIVIHCFILAFYKPYVKMDHNDDNKIFVCVFNIILSII